MKSFIAQKILLSLIIIQSRAAMGADASPTTGNRFLDVIIKEQCEDVGYTLLEKELDIREIRASIEALHAEIATFPVDQQYENAMRRIDEKVLAILKGLIQLLSPVGCRTEEKPDGHSCKVAAIHRNNLLKIAPTLIEKLEIIRHEKLKPFHAQAPILLKDLSDVVKSEGIKNPNTCMLVNAFVASYEYRFRTEVDMETDLYPDALAAPALQVGISTLTNQINTAFKPYQAYRPEEPSCELKARHIFKIRRCIFSFCPSENNSRANVGACYLNACQCGEKLAFPPCEHRGFRKTNLRYQLDCAKHRQPYID